MPLSIPCALVCHLVQVGKQEMVLGLVQVGKQDMVLGLVQGLHGAGLHGAGG